jgi:hypothetical protein
MKKLLISIFAAAGFCAIAAQNSSLSIREVRDPVKLKAILEANATDAESRLVAAETTIGTNENVVVTGTIAVTGVATFTAAPKLTAATAEGAIALVITNGPAATNARKADPIYLTVSVGTNSYVVPAWYLTP